MLYSGSLAEQTARALSVNEPAPNAFSLFIHGSRHLGTLSIEFQHLARAHGQYWHSPGILDFAICSALVFTRAHPASRGRVCVPASAACVHGARVGPDDYFTCVSFGLCL